MAWPARKGTGLDNCILCIARRVGIVLCGGNVDVLKLSPVINTTRTTVCDRRQPAVRKIDGSREDPRPLAKDGAYPIVHAL
eukprot:scaffold3884_cov392-Prasinococcus_capsulatus_cf.AAC.4